MTTVDRKSERHERISELFLKVCDLPDAEREIFLREECGGDSQLYEEVAALVAQDRAAAEVFETGALEREVGAAAAELAGSGAAECPERIGPYRIREVLGEGGMGAVYLAERDGGEPGLVALKVIKEGMDTQQIILRFESERRVLELLQHPNIARILDAGETDEGRPYFVMEYVSGVPITRYCDEHRMGVRERLDLFLQVCKAAEYAHSKGVVHRDLKPSNVIVRDVDGKPRATIIDFGIAKATREGIALKTQFTAQGLLIGTPEYMSPEQAGMGAVDARSDVYSLGVLLYELLTGELPFDRAQLRDGGYQQVLETICRVQPVTPSRRVGAPDARAASSTTQRATGAGSLSRLLRGSLDRIVMKALAKEKQRRYGSAEEIAGDLERYLRGDAVLAPRVAGVLPAAGRWARAHRMAVAGVLTLAAVIGAVATVQVWQQRELALLREREREQKQEQERELVREREWGARRAAAGIIDALYRVRDRPSDSRTLLNRVEGLSANWLRIPDIRLAYAQASYSLSKNDKDTYRKLVATKLLKEVPGSHYVWLFKMLLSEIDPGAAPELAPPPRNDAEAWYLWSLATLDPAVAKERVERAVALAPGFNLAWWRLVDLYRNLKDLPSALSAVHMVLSIEGQEARAALAEADLLMLQERYNEAASTYSRLLSRHSSPSDEVALLLRRGTAYLCLRKYEWAEKDLTDTINLMRGGSEYTASWCYYYRATPRWLLGNYDAAAADYRNYVKLQGDNWYAAARLFLVRQDQAKWLAGDRKDLEARREDKESRTDLAQALGGTMRGTWLQKVYKCLKGDIAPDRLVKGQDGGTPERRCEAYYYAGEALLLRGQTDSARSFFRRAVETRAVLDQERLPVYAVEDLPITPMNEWHLACGRLDQLEGPGSCARAFHGSPAGASP